MNLPLGVYQLTFLIDPIIWWEKPQEQLKFNKKFEVIPSQLEMPILKTTTINCQQGEQCLHTLDFDNPKWYSFNVSVTWLPNWLYFNPQTNTISNSGEMFSWSISFTVRVSVNKNGKEYTEDTPVIIHIEKAPNHKPTINSVTWNTTIKQWERLILTANASDPDKDSLNYIWTVVGKTYTWKTLNLEWLSVWNHTITLKVEDWEWGVASKNISVNVEAINVNNAPIINQTNFNWGWLTNTKTFPNVVSDDGDLSKITMTASPNFWTLVYNGDGSITYTRTDWESSWTDSFSVTFSDWKKQTTATMNFTRFDDE